MSLKHLSTLHTIVIIVAHLFQEAAMLVHLICFHIIALTNLSMYDEFILRDFKTAFATPLFTTKFDAEIH